MKLKYLIILLLFTSCRQGITSFDGNPFIGGSYTEIEGNISGVLSASESPFLVIDDIQILSTDTLIIEPDVTLYFKNGKRFIIEGLLISIGEKYKQITYRSYDDNTWLGITITNSTVNNEFHYSNFQEIERLGDNTISNGAIEIISSNVVFQNCNFRYNSAERGGGVYSENSTIRISNCIFQFNSADYYGGAMLLDASSISIINNTIFNNRCFNYGGGVVLNNPVNSDLQNNIFYDNFATSGDRRIALLAGDSSNVNEQYNFLAFGNLNPFFKSSDNLRLSTGSPCIDAGNPAITFNDADGTRNDQGAYGGPNGDW